MKKKSLGSREILEVAGDALHFRRLVQLNPGSCSAYNQAAAELVGFGADALPVIEQLVVDDVVPVLEADVSDSFMGIHMLFNSYVQIGAEVDSIRVAAFFRSLPSHLRAIAVSSISRKYRFIDRQCYRDGKPPPLELVDFIRECASSDHQQLRNQSIRSLSIMSVQQ